MMSMTEAPRRHRSPRLDAVTALAALMVVTGCAQNAPQLVREAELNDAVPTWVPEAELQDAVDCRSEPSWLIPDEGEPPADPSIPAPGRVPVGFDATAAVRCSLEFDLAPVGEPGDVFWRVERFEGDLGPLLDALAASDDGPPPGELLCAADMEFVPALWLEARAGGFLPVHYPRNACGKTKPAVRTALDGLQVTMERILVAR